MRKHFQDALNEILQRERMRDDGNTGAAGIASAKIWIVDASKHFDSDQYSECYLLLERALGSIFEAMSSVATKAEKLPECKSCGQYFSSVMPCMCVDEDEKPVPGVAIKRGEKFDGSDEVYRG